VDAAIGEIRSHVAGAKVDGIEVDFSDPSGAQKIIAKLPAVDVLVNNVGILSQSHFVKFPTPIGTAFSKSMS
jgi:short-subunit dehydrogenase